MQSTVTAEQFENAAASPPAVEAAAPASSMLEKLWRLGLSVGLWVLYVPHYSLLRMLGPRLGMRWVRLAANIHWLLTFVGAQRSARRALASMRPYFNTQLSVSQILRRHLLMKHQCFALARVYQDNVDPQHELRWTCNPACTEAIPTADRNSLQRQRGLMIVGYHFNFFQLSPAALKGLLPGIKLGQLRYRNSQSVESAASPIARLALKRALVADRRSGLKVFYVDRKWGLVSLFRYLRQGGAVTLAADGGVADDFVEVPFFDGTLRVPSGWAKLAAATRSDILLLADRELDERTREGWFFDNVRCDSTSDDAAYAAVAESVRVLEQMIREEPWGWHPWQRLRVEVDPRGERRYHLKKFSFEAGEQQPNEPTRAAQRKDDSTRSMGNDAPPRRPRVAVLANSLTPYRIHLHERIVEEVPEVELCSLATHGNAYHRWSALAPPAAIRPVNFSHGEPTNEQTQHRYAVREWFKGGRVIRWLREHQIEAVFCQGCGDFGRLRVMRWCRRHGIPCFLTGDFNICSDNHRPLKRWLKRQVYGQAVRWSAGLMPCGHHGLTLLNRYGGESKPAIMFPFVPDVELFENTPAAAIDRASQKFRLQPARRRIVFSARMMPAKRPDLAIQAFAKIAGRRPQWDLVMLGDGPLRAELEASVPAPLRDRIRWTGFVNDTAEVAGVYAMSDALLLPSDHEPWGVVVVEAAAAGLAMIASDVVGAAPELIHHGRNGSLFKAGDQQSLELALLEVTDDHRIDALKRQSREVIKEWLAACDPVAGFRAALAHGGLPPSVQPEPVHAIARQRESEGLAAASA